MLNYYQVLGVQEGTAPEMIKEAYRKLSKKFHPDANADDPFFKERFQEVQEAYEILSDQYKRTLYNQDLEELKFFLFTRQPSPIESGKAAKEKRPSAPIHPAIKTNANQYIVPVFVALAIVVVNLLIFSHSYYQEPPVSPQHRGAPFHTSFNNIK